MNRPTIVLQFDRPAMTLASVLCNGETDEETARLQKIADAMLAAPADQEKVSEEGASR